MLLLFMFSILENEVIVITVDMDHHGILMKGGTHMDTAIVAILIIQIATMMGMAEMSREIDIMIINMNFCLFIRHTFCFLVFVELLRHSR